MSNLSRTRILASALMVTGLLAISGCATGGKDCCSDGAKVEKTSAAPATTDKAAAKTTANVTVVNTVCPLSGEGLGKDHTADVTRTYNGENVGFCCNGCAKKFDAMSDEKKAAILTTAKSH